MERILVTGAAGFIGSHLCEKLLANPRVSEVVGLDNFDPFYPIENKKLNLRSLSGNAKFRFIEGDIRSSSTYSELLKEVNPSAIIHLAALAGVQPSIQRPLDYWETNIIGTERLLSWYHQQRGNDPKRVLFASSSSVYGNSTKMPLSEDDIVDHPISPYAATKKAGELLCYTHHHLNRMQIACLRFFTVYGPRQRPDLAIRKFTQKIMAGQPIELYGDGNSFRDYTYVGDTVRGLELCLEFVLDCPQPFYDVFNIGYGEPLKLIEMVKLIEDVLGKKAVIQWSSAKPGDVNGTFADTRKFKKTFGYKPNISHREGFRNTVQWLLETKA